MDAATVIVTLLLAALFMFSASIKLLGVSRSLAIRDHLGVKRMAPAVVGIALAAATAVLHLLEVAAVTPARTGVLDYLSFRSHLSTK